MSIYVTHANPDLRVVLKWMVIRSGSVISIVIRLMKPIHTTTILFSLALASPAIAQDAISTATKTIKATASVIAKENLTKPSIDEQLCELWLTKYLETLDPSKLYFLDTDISEFRNHVSKLPKYAADGNTELFKLVSERYQLRANSALEHALDRIDRAFDFTVDENIPLQYEKWPKTNDDRIERWRLQLKYDLLVERSRTTVANARIEFLKSRYESICKQANEQTEQQALGLYLDCFCRTVDPHSGYFTQKEFNSFMGGMTKEYTIGLKISTKNGRAIILGFAPEFQREPAAPKILGCELLAVRSQDGDVYNCREIFPSTTRRLTSFGLNQDNWVTLELYDQVLKHRFAINWPRK